MYVYTSSAVFPSNTKFLKNQRLPYCPLVSYVCDFDIFLVASLKRLPQTDQT